MNQQSIDRILTQLPPEIADPIRASELANWYLENRRHRLSDRWRGYLYLATLVAFLAVLVVSLNVITNFVGFGRSLMSFVLSSITAVFFFYILLRKGAKYLTPFFLPRTPHAGQGSIAALSARVASPIQDLWLSPIDFRDFALAAFTANIRKRSRWGHIGWMTFHGAWSAYASYYMMHKANRPEPEWQVAASAILFGITFTLFFVARRGMSGHALAMFNLLRALMAFRLKALKISASKGPGMGIYNLVLILSLYSTMFIVSFMLFAGTRFLYCATVAFLLGVLFSSIRLRLARRKLKKFYPAFLEWGAQYYQIIAQSAEERA